MIVYRYNLAEDYLRNPMGVSRVCSVWCVDQRYECVGLQFNIISIMTGLECVNVSENRGIA